MIKNLASLVELAKSKRKRKIAVASAGDMHVLDAISNAVDKDIVEPILVGDEVKIREISEKIGFDINPFEIYNVPDKQQASIKAVELIKAGKAEILMKGLVSTGVLLKAVLDKDHGLRKGALLSHVAIFETPYYHKLLGVTDAAMNVKPDLIEKIGIIKNAIEVFHRLGNPNPKVAIVGSVETINPKMEATMHAATISMMNYRKQITGCIIDGPLAIDGAVSKAASEVKNITSDVAGDVDLILAPNIDGANILYKTMNFLGGAVAAAVIMGAKVPIVLTSRGDTEKSKFLSIALAAAIA
ncbi:MAG: bifunctional enoyl-CoA hydratase/phosphate acetyltransferase [Bacteroidales bacterium]|nr:bifunctional enoyl-CoA hydratase/phosphate acetyltransferase [Bacteroidales bacterium]